MTSTWTSYSVQQAAMKSARLMATVDEITKNEEMKWISVKDRLPKMKQDVIASIEDTTGDCGGMVVPLIFCIEGHGFGFHCITVNGVLDYSDGVTHWMSLPEPPTK